MKLKPLNLDRLEARVESLRGVIESSFTTVLSDVSRAFVSDVLIAAAGDEPQVEEVTITDPTTVSLDSLGQVYSVWETELIANVVPAIAEVFAEAAENVAAQVDAVLPTEMTIPRVSSVFVEDKMALATNRLRGIGNEIWETIRDEVSTGMEDGESITELRDRILNVANMEEYRAERIARTEVISAANGGEYDQIQLIGATGTKEWLATEDARTRKSHIAANGQSVAIADPFSVGGFSLKYPGDPSGPASEIVNCRCTTLYDLDEESLNEMESATTASIGAPPFIIAAGINDVSDLSTSGMIALVPSAEDIARITIPGGEVPEELHLTLWFLDNVDQYDEAVFIQLTNKIQEIALNQAAISASGFGVSFWNPESDHSCLVMNVGGSTLESVRNAIGSAIYETWAIAMPEQYCPWVPHIALSYTDSTDQVTDVIDRLGLIKFTHVRVAFGRNAIDIPLMTNGFTASIRETGVMSVNDAMSVMQFNDSEYPMWEGVLVVEDVETGDGRKFSPGALMWAVPPLPLMWQRESDDGHRKSVVVGRIDNVWRDPTNMNMIRGSGVLTDYLDGLQVTGMIRDGFMNGVSVDVDSVKDADIELVFPQDDESDVSGEDDALSALFGAPPETVIIHRGRIRGATIVSLPAFVEAKISLVDITPGSPSASGIPSSGVGEASGVDAIVASIAPIAPESWFANPNFIGPTPLTVTDDGRIFGHAALFNSCHIGIANGCIRPPFEASHDFFRLGGYRTSDGSEVAVGGITIGTGHAATYGITAAQAIEHYDNTGTRVADVAVGNDDFGIWFAGAVRPGISEPRLAELRAAALSGDWRRIGGTLRLVALLAVNVPGFPVPRLSTAMSSGQQTALVASGIMDHSTAMATLRETLRSRVTATKVNDARKHLRERMNVNV